MKANLNQVFAALPTGAVGSFNVLDLDMAASVVSAAEAVAMPVIIGVAARHLGMLDMPRLMPALQHLAQTAAVPVALHLDHAGPQHVPKMEQLLQLGFTSVMFDGSELPLSENRTLTAHVVAQAKRYRAGVEAELGAIAGEEGVADTHTDAPQRLPYTDPDEAREFALETGIDALAVAIGTAHGIYREVPHVSLETVSALRSKISIPLVMHGATGLPDALIRDAVRCGIRKVNYFSGLLETGMDTVRRHAGREGNDLLALKRDMQMQWYQRAFEQILLYAAPKPADSVA